MNVLIIEDSLPTAMMLEAFVSACGHQSICVPGAWLACSAADEWAIDLVLLDIVLPGVDGYELATRMRKQGLRAPIIAVTGLEDDPVKRQQCGIDGYLAKPVSMKALKALLEEPALAINA
jgi:DNA-binding response OmpR family regulator